MIERRANTQSKPDKVPIWMVTFADLMALMMTFFVLLFSFSKMDENKYKSIVDSMAVGFDGAQWIKRRMGSDSPAGPEPGIFQPPLPATPKTIKQEKRKDSLYDTIHSLLEKQIKQGEINLLHLPDGVLLRFPEKVSFNSGSDALLETFFPIIENIGQIVRETNARITISGHTDDVPINTQRFRSNWDLSSARAVSVAHALIMGGQLYKNRITIEGHADTQPLKPNSNHKNRAANRRVEISIRFDSTQHTSP